MKLSLIASQYPFSGRVPLVPPILEYLAALTLREMPDAEITLVDANQQNILPHEIKSEVVAISAMTATAVWAYDFADACRKHGRYVILGGIHPTALPEEAAMHADTVVVGEAESVWGTVLYDIRAGNPKKFYRGERLPLVNLPKPIDGKLKGNYRFRAFFTMRGCPYRCTFCSVRRFFGDTIRYRPINEVVDEIETCAGKMWFNGDDNIWGADMRRSTELFTELAKGTKRKWYGFGDLRSVQSPQGKRMLKAARESGLFSVWVGWESDDAHLKAFNAGGKQGADRVTAVKIMQDAGIDVTLFVVLGGREDSLDSFKRTLELSEKLKVGVHPVLLTPLPGTELYEEYKEFLLPGMGWDSFVGVRAVFEHPVPEMSPMRRELEYHYLVNRLFRFGSIIKRIAAIPRSGFPATHILSFMMQLPMKLAFGKAYEEWKSNVQSKFEAPEIYTNPSAVQRSTQAVQAQKSMKFSPKALVPRSINYKKALFISFAFCLVVISITHFFHEWEEGRIFIISRGVHALDLLEEFFFGLLLLSGMSILFLRQIKLIRWRRIVKRIASDKIEHWALAIKEFAYSTLIGSGLYWAYVLMAELI